MPPRPTARSRFPLRRPFSADPEGLAGLVPVSGAVPASQHPTVFNYCVYQVSSVYNNIGYGNALAVVLMLITARPRFTRIPALIATFFVRRGFAQMRLGSGLQ